MNNRFRQQVKQMIKSRAFERMAILDLVDWIVSHPTLGRKRIKAIMNQQRRGREKRNESIPSIIRCVSAANKHTQKGTYLWD